MKKLYNEEYLRSLKEKSENVLEMEKYIGHESNDLCSLVCECLNKAIKEEYGENL